jgi:hypothetical protein
MSGQSRKAGLESLLYKFCATSVFCCTVSAAAGFLGIATQPQRGLTKPVDKKSQNAKYNRENLSV